MGVTLLEAFADAASGGALLVPSRNAALNWSKRNTCGLTADAKLMQRCVQSSADFHKWLFPPVEQRV